MWAILETNHRATNQFSFVFLKIFYWDFFFQFFILMFFIFYFIYNKLKKMRKMSNSNQEIISVKFEKWQVQIKFIILVTD